MQGELGDAVARQFDLEVLAGRAVDTVELDAGRHAEGEDAADPCGDAFACAAIDDDVELVRAGEGHDLGALAQAAHAMLQVIVTDAQAFAFDAAVEEVHRPEEAIHERCRRVAIDLFRRADLLDVSVVHQHHAVGHLERFFLVVGDEDRGDVQVVVQFAQPAPQLLPHLGVERAEGLVEQQHARLHRQRAGERDALALAAGELRRKAVGQPVELHQVQQFMHLVRDLLLRRALAARLHAHAEGHVVEHRHVAEQRVVLEHEADLAVAHVRARGVLAVEQHLAGVGLFQPGDDAQQRGLAAARGTEQGDQFAGGEIERDVVERVEGAEALVDVGVPGCS